MRLAESKMELPDIKLQLSDVLDSRPLPCVPPWPWVYQFLTPRALPFSFPPWPKSQVSRAKLSLTLWVTRLWRRKLVKIAVLLGFQVVVVFSFIMAQSSPS